MFLSLSLSVSLTGRSLPSLGRATHRRKAPFGGFARRAPNPSQGPGGSPAKETHERSVQGILRVGGVGEVFHVTDYPEILQVCDTESLFLLGHYIII